MKRLKVRAVGEELETLFCVAVMIMTLLFILTIFVDMTPSNRKEDIKREYILRMESTGYMTPDDMTSMKSELESIGAYDISFNGTTISKVEYGQYIYLNVTGKIKTSGIKGATGALTWIRGQDYEEFTIQAKSTSKSY